MDLIGPFAQQMASCLSLSENVAMVPVDGVSMTVRIDGVGKGFEVEWRDVRGVQSSSDADVSRNATPRAHSEAILSVQGLLKVVLKIAFGDEQRAQVVSPTMAAGLTPPKF